MSWTSFSRRFARGPEPRSAFDSFEAYIRLVNPRFRFYRHVRAIMEALEATERGEIANLMIWMPPGTSKSETVSRLFGSYFVAKNPRRSVGQCSYGAMLAQEMTRDAREYYVEAGGQLDPSQRAKTRWLSTAGGGMWGAGFGGAVRGLRYHLGITDDPHKSPEDISSDLKRERLFRWWDQTWMNRGHLFADDPVVRVVVMQRLADNDLCGWLLGRPDADKWTILPLDAVRDEEDPYPIPDGVSVLPDWRHHGELLCPEALTLERLEEQRMDPDSYESQFQQRPRAASGKVLEPSWFRRVLPEHLPPMAKRGLGVDLAVSTRQTADYTVGFPVGIGVDNNVYLFRPFRDRVESPIARQEIAAVARRTRCGMVFVESVAFQLSFVQELRAMREMAGFSVLEADADRDKLSRARGWSHLAFQGRIFLVDDGSGWPDVFLDECRKFPTGRHDDQIDAVGIALAGLRMATTRQFLTGVDRPTILTR